MSNLTSASEGFAQPFEPMLGETYELQTDAFEFIAEQVSQEPPIAAWHARSLNTESKNAYKIWSSFATRLSLSGGALSCSQVYPTYVELRDKRYALNPQTLSVHNLLSSEQPYLDIGGKSTLVCYDTHGNIEAKMELTNFRRAWLSRDHDFKCQAKMIKSECTHPEGIPDESLTIEGRWNSHLDLVVRDDTT